MMTGQSRSPVEILLVDDSPSDVELTTLALEEGAIPSRVNVAEDGIEALAFLRREGRYADAPRPDLILLDLNLPRKDGRETLAEISRDPDLNRIPIVIVTVSETERHLLETYDLAPNCYFVKPIDFEGFLAAIQSVAALAKGSEVLPAAPAEEVSEEVLRVLMMEDNPADVDLVREYLRTSDEAAFTLEDVDAFGDGLKRLGEARFDVVLLDLSVLPGRDLSEGIGAIKRAAKVAVVVLTGLDDERLGVEAVQVGAQDYLAKGRAEGDLLVRSLRFAVERQRRKDLQAQLYQSQRLEGIGRLAGGIAHDFNNILTAILGFTELAQDAAAHGDDPQDHLGYIEKAAQRAAGLTQQLLGFARKQMIHPQVLNLNDRVLDVEKILRRLITEDIELVMQLAPDLGLVKADPGQLEQILVNLVVNARDAMPNGGQIEIRTANVRLDEKAASLSEARPDDYVLLSVRDAGVGMSEEVKAHLFEPFFTTKEQGKGTGLGLATCHGIVTQNRGAIAVDSAPGQGATFRIYLPRLREKAVSAATHTAHACWEPMPRGDETILLVEDEPMVREIAFQTLHKLGYRVLEAANGEEALWLADALAGRFHLLLTDVIMPQMSGKEIASRLRAIHPQTRVLYMSGYAEDTIAHHGVLEEGIAFLQKPFMPAILARKVRELLDR